MSAFAADQPLVPVCRTSDDLALTAIAIDCCLRYGQFACLYRQPIVTVEEGTDPFCRYYDLARTLTLSTTQDMSHPLCT